MGTLLEKVKQQRTRQVYSIVCLETGSWLGEYSTFDGTNNHGHRCFHWFHCTAKKPADAQYFENIDDVEQCLRGSNKGEYTYVMVTVHLPQ